MMTEAGVRPYQEPLPGKSGSSAIDLQRNARHLSVAKRDMNGAHGYPGASIFRPPKHGSRWHAQCPKYMEQSRRCKCSNSSTSPSQEIVPQIWSISPPMCRKIKQMSNLMQEHLLFLRPPGLAVLPTLGPGGTSKPARQNRSWVLTTKRRIYAKTVDADKSYTLPETEN